jgi:primosomal protein N' (replication factor Y)
MLLPLYPAADSSSKHPRYAEVILPLSLPQTLTYGIPLELQGTVEVGMRVEVPLGSNKLYTGLVAALHDRAPEAYEVKPLRSVLDESPVVNSTQLKFWDWIGHYYLATPGEVMQAALPAHLKLQSETRLLWTGLTEDADSWSSEGYLAFEALQIKKELSISEVRVLAGPRHFIAVLHELLERGAALIDESLQNGYRPKKEKIIVLAPAYSGEDSRRELFNTVGKAPKQLELLLAFSELAAKNGTVRQVDLLERTGASSAQVKALVDKGIFIVEEIDVDRTGRLISGEPKEITFTEAQDNAYKAVKLGMEETGVTLLHGVTGSGKTLLYLQLIRDVLATGKQAVFLLPEIGLTTQLVSRLYDYFGEELGVYHSRFSDNERVEIWEKVRSGKYKVVVGPRSALWLPFADLGLIVVDEEHDPSYKQKDPAPRFHARDAAVYLASLYGAKIVLGSATPSVESLYNSEQGKYALVELKERYRGVKLPVIEIVNAKSIEAFRGQGIELLTPELVEAIKDALERRRQVILFQNRRGYSPFQLCTMCGYVPQCKNCAVSLTYHKSTDKLHCHYCGTKSAVIHTCPQCGSNRIRSRSFGTEKIEEEVQKVFPQARVARMDVDSTRNKGSLSDLLDKMQRQSIDILVGTQMVVKGLDFAPVALVGVLSADGLLSFPDFRVNERAFQLMEQVSGRAGRADGAGRVIIQAYNLDHPTLGWVQAHDVDAFFRHELRYRELFGYPPFSRLLKAVFRHRDEAKAGAAASELANTLGSIEGILVQGPVPGLVPRVRSMYIFEVWVKCPRDRAKLEEVKATLLDTRRRITGARGNGALQVQFDVDPA